MLDHIATPPSLETGFLWIFLSFGKSTKPSFFEYAITRGTINTPKINEIIAPIICTCTCPSVRIVLSPILFNYTTDIFCKVLVSVHEDFLKLFHYRKHIPHLKLFLQLRPNLLQQNLLL